MSSVGVELALGTVQFGMRYGVASPDRLLTSIELQQIFSSAWEGGIRVLDTAPAYGNIEERLATLFGPYAFSTVSKIPAIPHDLSMAQVEQFVTSAIDQTRKHLGESLNTLLFHCSDDLLAPNGDRLWQIAAKAIADSTIRLGVSCYSPAELQRLGEKFPIDVAQLPGNVLDQRLYSLKLSQPVELHLRSIFLQGLLLLPLSAASRALPDASQALKIWHAWCNEQGLTPLHAALGIAKGLPGVRYCVVGVDSLAHLNAIIEAWADVQPLQIAALASHDLGIIDPRRWKVNA